MGNEGKDVSGGMVTLAFLVGGVVGAAIALLLAPKAGVETRETIKDISEEIKEKLAPIVTDLRDKLEDTIKEGIDYLEKKKSILTSAIEAGKEAIEKEREKISVQQK